MKKKNGRGCHLMNRMSFFDSCANVVMNEIQITSFDPDDDHPTIEEEF